jgi:hypothetical protein
MHRRSLANLMHFSHQRYKQTLDISLRFPNSNRRRVTKNEKNGKERRWKRFKTKDNQHMIIESLQAVTFAGATNTE